MVSVILLAAVFAVVLIAGTGISLYNNLVQLKANVDKAWANIDVLLKQRHDELPKLIDTCKGYMKYEQALLEKLTLARTAFLSSANNDEKVAAENNMSKLLKNVFAVAENYPDLKANHGFVQLQSRISSLENNIADRRELFNESVNLYNVGIQQFPAVLISKQMGFEGKKLLEVPGSDTQDVKIDI